MLIGLLIFAAIGLITPGPNNVLLLNSGLKFGYRKSVFHILGIGFGLFSLFLTVGNGVSKFFSQYPFIESILQILCSLYLVYLSYKIINTSTDLSDESNDTEPMSFLNAFLFQWMNPKAWTLALTVISIYNGIQFENPIFIISVCFLVVSLITSSLWVVFGLQIKKILKNAKQERILNIFMGCSLLSTLFIMF
ncbi:LysE family translocator [Halobacteriovorax sp. GFR7]|uniref:LysE family translocator n=1 Tax=unclassified Halobacteriovorax TaxID=2639665 RepID=UPI003D98FE0C